jgi:hypothetical protein
MIGESLLARYRAAGKYPRIIMLVLIAAAAGYGLFVRTPLVQIHEFNNRELGHGAKIVEDVVAGIVITAEKWGKEARAQLDNYDQLSEGLRKNKIIDVSGYMPIGSLGSGQGKMPSPPKYWPVRLTWARPDGSQFLKAETKLDLTPPTNIAGRPYFQGILSGERWSIDGSPGFIIHPGRSIVDGQFYSYLAMPSRIYSPPPGQCQPGCARGPAVALMNLNLRSVSSQPMPIRIWFCRGQPRRAYALPQRLPTRAPRGLRRGSGAALPVECGATRR